MKNSQNWITLEEVEHKKLHMVYRLKFVADRQYLITVSTSDGSMKASITLPAATDEDVAYTIFDNLIRSGCTPDAYTRTTVQEQNEVLEQRVKQILSQELGCTKCYRECTCTLSDMISSLTLNVECCEEGDNSDLLYERVVGK